MVDPWTGLDDDGQNYQKLDPFIRIRIRTWILSIFICLFVCLFELERFEMALSLCYLFIGEEMMSISLQFFVFDSFL